jgi:transcriptional regulator with XRE-family HTH domain
MLESLGPVLTRVRMAHGWSQLRVAELLCAASGTPTVTRHEISRWEREERIPSGFWLGWLGLVLDVPIETLSGAAVLARRNRPACRSGSRPAWTQLDAKARPDNNLAPVDAACGGGTSRRIAERDG